MKLNCKNQRAFAQKALRNKGEGFALFAEMWLVIITITRKNMCSRAIPPLNAMQINTLESIIPTGI
ncbi:MAG: hypothetical protein RR069_01785 [Oscillospiraceae bacterium]